MLFSLILHFVRNESRLMKSLWCVCMYAYVAICVSPPSNFWKPKPFSVKLGTYIMPHRAITTAYFTNPSYE
jgi:hypothetical protein